MSSSADEARTRQEERRRMLAENARRRGLVDERYAPWSLSERLMTDERRRVAAAMLHRAGVFPRESSRCLEVGFGDATWLVDLLAFRVRESRLFGVEVDPSRAAAVKSRLPAATLAVTGGTDLPWRSGSFDLVIASTVFTSILDDSVQRQLAAEITRVLRPGGALLWYDFAFSNPRNPQVHGLPHKRLRALFPELEGKVRRVTLAPPILRRIAPWSLPLTQLLSSFPFLRTHLLGVLLKAA